VLVAGSRAQAEALKEQTAEFMAKQMRLTLSPEKTRITHIDDGLDFLGWRIKRYHRPGRAPVALTFPSDRALGDIKHRIKKLTARHDRSLALLAHPRAQSGASRV
jgi:RNA-directed DNA polymerase